MRILDRYVGRQLVPIWIWCLIVFVFLSCLIDLFGHLDEILRYHVPAETVFQYYLQFVPFVFVRASPMALLLAAAFVTMQLARHHELLAMNATGTSLLRASVPFLFIGWLVSICVFVVNDRLVPGSTVVHERIKQEAFRDRRTRDVVENVAVMDDANRIYHARQLDIEAKELVDLTVLEQDRHNRPTKSLYASRAIWTKHGWLLLYGTLYRTGPQGTLQGMPQPFVERLISYPVTPEAFIEPEARPETMRYNQLRRLITGLRQSGITNVRRYSVELAAKLTMPLLNIVLCLIGFVGAGQPKLRGHIRGLGISLGWGICYYLGVGMSHAIAKQWPIPVMIAVWLPHLAAVWWCIRRLRLT